MNQAAAENTHADSASRLPPGTNMAVAGLTGLAFAAYVAFVALYSHFGTPLVQRMHATIGETLLDRGVRFEQVGEYENAAQCYREALECRFDGPKDRTFALKRLGALLWWRDGAEAALPYLEEAYAQPDFPITLFEPLCASLVDVARVDEALDVARRWSAAAAAHPGQQASAKYYEGRVYIQRGETDRALQAFLEGNDIVPGGFNAYEAAILYYRAGDLDKALPLLEGYLRGGKGDRAKYARSLRERILERQNAGPN